MDGIATFRKRESGSPFLEYGSKLEGGLRAATGKPAISRTRDFWAIRVRGEDVFLRIRRQHGQETLPKIGNQLVEINYPKDH